MNPISLSASSLTWTTLPALAAAVLFTMVVHAGWTWLEKKYFPVAPGE